MTDLLDLQETLGISKPSPLVPLSSDRFEGAETKFWVKRDDQIHPIISGNKWRKLSSTLLNIVNSGAKRILSFGGGYSNHLHALAYCCHKLDLKLTAAVRGNYSANPTPMITDMQKWGADCVWLTKTDYQRRGEADFCHALASETNSDHIIPEGGSNDGAIDGTAEIISELPDDIDLILCPVASGGTMAGLLEGILKLKRITRVMGIAVLKGEDYLENLVSDLLRTPSLINEIDINHEFHCGGYAKSSPNLTRFCTDWHHHCAIPIEPVYSGKLFFATQTMAHRGDFEHFQNVVLLHTGGLQGNR